MSDITSKILFGKSVSDMTDEELAQHVHEVRSRRRNPVTEKKKAKAKKSTKKLIKGASKEDLLEMLDMLGDL